MKISAALIVKNEADHIETVLESLAGFDEIVVLDTGSIDNTIELAKKYTDKVFTDYAWNDHFAEARNMVLSKCTGDWVLSIDGDEKLETEGLEKIKVVIKDASLEQLTFSVQMWGGTQLHYLPRLFKNNGQVHWVGRAHELLEPTQDNYTKIRITYGRSNAHDLDPFRMQRILYKAIEEDPSPRNYYYLAREYYYRGDWDAAIEMFKHYVSISRWNPEKADGYLLLARSLFQAQRGNEAREACLRAIEINPAFREALYFMSELHFSPWKERWLLFAQVANDQDVLFKRV